MRRPTLPRCDVVSDGSRSMMAAVGHTPVTSSRSQTVEVRVNDVDMKNAAAVLAMRVHHPGVGDRPDPHAPPCPCRP